MFIITYNDLIRHKVQLVAAPRFSPLSHLWERGLLSFVAKQV